MLHIFKCKASREKGKLFSHFNFISGLSCNLCHDVDVVMVTTGALLPIKSDEFRMKLKHLIKTKQHFVLHS